MNTTFTSESNLYKQAINDLMNIVNSGNAGSIREYVGEYDYHNPELNETPTINSYHPAIAETIFKLVDRIAYTEHPNPTKNYQQITILCEKLALYMVLARPERISK